MIIKNSILINKIPDILGLVFYNIAILLITVPKFKNVTVKKILEAHLVTTYQLLCHRSI